MRDVIDFETRQLMRRGWCFFSSAPSLPPPPPPVPTRADPAIAEAKKKTRLAALQRRGRRATFFAGKTPEAQLGDAPVTRPEARAAQVLG